LPARRLLAGYAIGVGARGAYRLLSSGALTLDLDVGRRVQPLGPVVETIAAPREVVIAAPSSFERPRRIDRGLDLRDRQHVAVGVGEPHLLRLPGRPPRVDLEADRLEAASHHAFSSSE
jgi:hypothetical protein